MIDIVACSVIKLMIYFKHDREVVHVYESNDLSLRALIQRQAARYYISSLQESGTQDRKEVNGCPHGRQIVASSSTRKPFCTKTFFFAIMLSYLQTTALLRAAAPMLAWLAGPVDTPLRGRSEGMVEWLQFRQQFSLIDSIGRKSSVCC